MFHPLLSYFFFFFNDPSTTEIYTLSLHDALPIYGYWWDVPAGVKYRGDEVARAADIYAAAFPDMHRDRKSTRLNSSHGYISYAVFCLKKKKKKKQKKNKIKKNKRTMSMYTQYKMI